ncbi:MAG: hypothetical protein ACRBFS_11540 [Aureispira sp.]
MTITSFYRLIIIGLLFGIIFSACERVVETLPQTDWAYYPIVQDGYRVYQIDSIVYDEYNCTVQTNSYQIKEVTGASIVDGEGQNAHRLERYWRANTGDLWTLVGVWSEKIEENQIQRIEDNQRFVKMVFPVEETKEWNGITYIRRDTLVPIRGGTIDLYKDWDFFSYQNVGQSYLDTVSNTVYPDAVQVMQVDKTNNIERRYSAEVYAKGVGLVYKEMRILDTQCRTPKCVGVSNIADCLNTPWETKTEKGYILIQSLMEHNY